MLRPPVPRAYSCDASFTSCSYVAAQNAVPLCNACLMEQDPSIVPCGSEEKKVYQGQKTQMVVFLPGAKNSVYQG